MSRIAIGDLPAMKVLSAVQAKGIFGGDLGYWVPHRLDNKYERYETQHVQPQRVELKLPLRRPVPIKIVKPR